MIRITYQEPGGPQKQATLLFPPRQYEYLTICGIKYHVLSIEHIADDERPTVLVVVNRVGGEGT